MLDRELWFVIVHWGDPNLTKKAIESLVNNEVPVNQIVVVENGMQFPEQDAGEGFVRIFKTHNKGYAAGTNSGIKEAIKAGASRVVVMNNDLQYKAGVIEEMEKEMKTKGLDLVGAVVDEGDGRPVQGGGRINWFRCKTYPVFDASKTKKIDYVSGAFFLITKACYLSVGPFPEKYFHTWEDVAYSYMVKRSGRKIGWAETPVLIHPRSQSMGESKIKTYYLVRNALIFADEFAHPVVKTWHLFLSYLRMLRALLVGRAEVYIGIRDALSHVSGKIEEHRIKV